MKARLIAISLAAMLTACSTTRLIPDGDQLYTGMKKIEYNDYEQSQHFMDTQLEVEAALACTPNGGLFGSPYYRTPLNYKLWIWNAYSQSEKPVSKWFCKTFGTQPVLMSNVNPQLRAQIAEGVLKKHGYFDGKVTYTTIDNKRNPKKAKIAYQVSMGRLTTLDSIAYTNFPEEMDTLIDTEETLLKKGDAFDVATLDAERKRASNVLRNNGYFYFQPSFMSYLADTVRQSGKADIRLQLADSLPEQVGKSWPIGNLTMELRKTMMDKFTDSISRGFLTVKYSGKKPPIRIGVLLRDLKLRKGGLYSIDKYNESISKINGNGIFSMVNMTFSPREDSLDMIMDCLFEKPYDFSIEGNLTEKTNGRMGPGLIIGLTKRNAFRGGEKLSLNLKGSYEWMTGKRVGGSRDRIDSYEYGGDISVEFPRILFPRKKMTRERIQRMREKNKRPRQFYSTPSTTIKFSRDILNRAEYYRLHTLGAELTYKWQPSATSKHEFSPISIEYAHLAYGGDSLTKLMLEYPSLYMALEDRLIPKIRYTYSYKSPASYNNPISWTTTLTEAGSLLSLAYMAAGKSWNEKKKELFKTPYAQYLKLRTDFTKTWRTGEKSKLVGHLAGGIIWSFGNSEEAPFFEKFYEGGANSVRAFSSRSLGPGSISLDLSQWAYIIQTGDLMLQANLEYRFPLFGSLYGATFLDAGNVWLFNGSDITEGVKFNISRLPNDIALGTGIGLRYDLQFLVIRIDWGIGIHAPYDTGKSGYFNMTNFKDGQTLHFAIGYPF